MHQESTSREAPGRWRTSARSLTVDDVATVLSTPVVTRPATADSVVHGVVDSTAESWTATDIVALRWEAARAGGPFPDLTPLLSEVLQIRPAAVVVTPNRPVNPPPVAVELADRANVAILWDREGSADVVATVGRLLDRHRSVCDRLTVDVDALSAMVLPVADDLRAVLDVLGAALGSQVNFRSAARAGGAGQLVGIGSLGVLEIDRTSPLSETERRLIDAVLPIVSMHARFADGGGGDRAVEASRSLKLILGEDLAEREQAIRRSRRLSLFTDRPVAFLAVEPFDVLVDIGGLQHLRDDIEPVAKHFDPDAVTLFKSGLVVVLIDATVDLESFQRALCRAVKAPIAVGAGATVSEPRGYPGSFRQASRAVAVGRSIGAINRLTYYRDLGGLGLLDQLPEHSRRSFVAETLGSIADVGADGLEQRRVLRMLRSTDCNITESARRLFLHPNTLRSRISRIEAVTGPILSDPERRLTVFTALAAFSLDNDVEA